MTPISVITLVRGRHDHLRNLVRGLALQSEPPDELVIAVMEQEPVARLPAAPFPVRQVMTPGREAPLARARNIAAASARGEALIFLDVDCIPGPDCVRDHLRDLRAVDGVKMGEVAYLPAGAARPGWRYAELEAAGSRHCDREGPPVDGPRKPCADYRCFWSLNFSIQRAAWNAIGGFDERYVGYGGEDTDFGRVAVDRGVALHWIRGGKVYHQHHGQHMPPVQHLETVLANALAFRDKWGEITMGHWLHAFELMGLIARDGETFRILRQPDEADLALTRQRADQPYTSTSWVIRELEARKSTLSQGVAAE